VNQNKKFLSSNYHFSLLYSAEPLIREKAVIELGNSGAVEVVKFLIQVLENDKEWAVRCSAARALGQLGESEALEPLIKVLSDNRDVLSQALQQEASYALSRLRGDNTPYLIKALESRDISTKIGVANVFANLKDSRGVEPLITLLEDSNLLLRLRVVQALGYQNDPRAVEPLLALLSDPDSSLRREIIFSLGKIKDRKSIEQILKSLDDKDEIVVEASILVLGDFGDNIALKPIFSVLLKRSESLRIRQAVGSTLGKFGEQGYFILIDALKHKNKFVRACASWGLRTSSLIDNRALEPLIITLNESFSEIRIHSAYALGRIGNKKAVEPLVNSLKDKDCNVREAVVFALGVIGDARALIALSYVQANDTEEITTMGHEVSWIAEEAIERIKNNQHNT
jgi:HEAT repeat protein